MEYEIFKLKFPYGMHIGNNSLESSNNSFCADTLFSALCIEAVKTGEDILNQLLDFVRAGELLISDGFPYVGEELFLPKPYMRINGSDDGSSVEKKQFKKMQYVAMSNWSSYLEGTLNPAEELELEKNIGWHATKTSCAIRGLDESKPYRVGTYTFSDNAGLYVIYGYENDDAKDLFYDLLDKLSFSGIGGKRSSGFGRFEIYSGELPDNIIKSLSEDASCFVSLSISLPNEEELNSVVDNASYMLEKRSGFVQSDSYSDTYMRKKDLFMFSAGSVFSRKFTGDIYDVSIGGNHPVYKYGKPILLGV